MSGPFTGLLLAACLQREQSFVEFSGALPLCLALHHNDATICRPGVAPIEYADGGRVELKVNKPMPRSLIHLILCSATCVDCCPRLTSVKTQLPYGYYTLGA